MHEPPAAIRATGIVVALTTALAILAIAFALPAARSKPHDIPIGAAGPQAAGGQVADILEQHAPGAFALTYYPGEAALRDAIRNRDVYGG
ncbi:MAG TPA: ABC transporter permease, partial [Mycobacterium sp.]|nr:ABC transporter permease [Mycobacterium sp.]